MIWHETFTTRDNESEIHEVTIQTRIIDAEFEDIKDDVHD